MGMSEQIGLHTVVQGHDLTKVKYPEKWQAWVSLGLEDKAL